MNIGLDEVGGNSREVGGSWGVGLWEVMWVDFFGLSLIEEECECFSIIEGVGCLGRVSGWSC